MMNWERNGYRSSTLMKWLIKITKNLSDDSVQAETQNPVLPTEYELEIFRDVQWEVLERFAVWQIEIRISTGYRKQM
jgi:hypothetical protein